MTKGIRTLLWVLGSLAALWMILGLAMWGSMGTMCPMCANRSAMMPNDMASSMSMRSMGWMMPMVWITGIVMLVLDGVFVYLVVAALRGRPRQGQPSAAH
jgi:hypothetical protein